VKVFSSKQFLLLISAATLREYTEAHVVYPRITVDWSVEPETFASAIHDAVEALDAAMGEVADPLERKAIEADLYLWHDDLRRAHLLSNRLAIQELRSAIESDNEAIAALEGRSETEIPLWILAHRETAFRNVELYLAFQAKSNGKFWKKHAIQPAVFRLVVAFILVCQAAFRKLCCSSLGFGVFGLRWTSLIGLQLRAAPDQRLGFA
jgi:hypothetical protein